MTNALTLPMNGARLTTIGPTANGQRPTPNDVKMNNLRCTDSRKHSSAKSGFDRNLQEPSMPRPFASCQVAFGLGSIPVKLYSATEGTERISFNMIHRECGSRIQQQLFCPKDERTITREETARGYEFSRGQYVLFNDEELKAMEEKATQTI